jgi:hypothetical protein
MTFRLFTFLLFSFLIFCSSNISIAQNLENIGQANPLKITGGVSLSQIVYAVDGIESRRDPYSYFASGNINFDLYGWSVPLTFTLSNQNTSIQQPFNQYGLHPTYKWITGHIGYVSMAFSPYTLNGHIFKGVGVDVEASSKLKVSAMYGRLQKAVEPDTTTNNETAPAFQRMGYGLKVSYGSDGDFVDLIFFKAEDDINSLSYVPEESGILPEENLVLGVNVGKVIAKRLFLTAEFASSAITRDTRAEASSLESKNVFSYTTGLYTHRNSSAYYNAIKSGLTYKVGVYSVSVGYERVEPEYRTLGSYYFNNDLENITVNTTAALLKGKVNLGVNVGTQRNNLDNEKLSSMKRLIGSFNIGYAATPRLNLAGSYSNFRTFTNIRSKFVQINELTPYDNLDTLDYTQISQSANLNIAYILSSEESKRQNINVNVSFQDATDEQGGVEQNSGSQFYNLNMAYNLNLVPRNLSITVAFNGSQNDAGAISTTTLGPTLTLNRSFLEKKLRATLSTSLNNAYTNSELVNRVINVRLNGSYVVRKKHNLNLSIAMLNRQNETSMTANSFTEYTATLGYSYNF